jgi:hypothetical protein
MLKQLPTCLHAFFPRLEELNLSNCLAANPTSFGGMQALKKLILRDLEWRNPPNLENLGGLEELDMSSWRNLVNPPDFSETPNIKALILKDCTQLEQPPVVRATNIEKIDMTNCRALEGQLDLSNCPNIKTVLMEGCPEASRPVNLPEDPLNLHL